MSTPAAEVFALSEAKRPIHKRIVSWVGYLIGELMAMGQAGMTPPTPNEILIVRLSDGSTATTYSEDFEPPAVRDAIAHDLASMTASEFESRWLP